MTGIFVLPAAALLVLAACQSGPQSLSLEEAKQVTASFEGGSFVPPPRTIQDITAILDEQKLDDPEKTGALAEEADLRTARGRRRHRSRPLLTEAWQGGGRPWPLDPGARGPADRAGLHGDRQSE